MRFGVVELHYSLCFFRDNWRIGFHDQLTAISETRSFTVVASEMPLAFGFKRWRAIDKKQILVMTMREFYKLAIQRPSGERCMGVAAGSHP